MASDEREEGELPDSSAKSETTLAKLANSPGMKAVMEANQAWRKLADSPGMKVMQANQAVLRLANSPGMKAVMEANQAWRKLADSPGMKVMQANQAVLRLANSPGMKAVMEANQAWRKLADSPGMTAWLESSAMRSLAIAAQQLAEQKEFNAALASLDERKVEQTAASLSRAQARLLIGWWVFLVVFFASSLFVFQHMDAVEAASPYTGGSCLWLAWMVKRAAEKAFDHLHPPNGD